MFLLELILYLDQSLQLFHCHLMELIQMFFQ